MYVVREFDLRSSVTTIELPTASMMLGAQWVASRESICLWVVCDTGPVPRQRDTFLLVASGDTFNAHMDSYVSTVQTPDRIVHVFRRYEGRVGSELKP